MLILWIAIIITQIQQKIKQNMKLQQILAYNAFVVFFIMINGCKIKVYCGIIKTYCFKLKESQYSEKLKMDKISKYCLLPSDGFNFS